MAVSRLLDQVSQQHGTLPQIFSQLDDGEDQNPSPPALPFVLHLLHPSGRKETVEMMYLKKTDRNLKTGSHMTNLGCGKQEFF